MNEKINRAVETMRNFICFSGINDKEFKEIVRADSIHTIRMERALCYQDDIADKVFLLIEGSVRKVRWREDSTSIIVGKGLSSSWIGLAEVITQSGYLYDAITEEESIVMVIDNRRFQKILEIKSFMRVINFELAKGYYNLYSEMDTHKPIQKIIRFIKTYVETFDTVDELTNNPIIEITQENLAESIGVTRETVSKYMRQLQDSGIISIGRGRIEIIDKHGLDSVEM
jgi:CRP/FNR family transcriptional regulator